MRVLENAVLAQLRRAGVELRAAGKVTADDVEEMRRLRRVGWTYQAIGDEFGVTRVAVTRRLRSGGPSSTVGFRTGPTASTNRRRTSSTC